MVGVVTVPEEFLNKLKKSVLPQYKACFITAIIIGLIAHLYKITNWLPNWDSIVFRYDAQNMLNIGRWFLPVVSAPSSFYDLPWLTGIIAIIFYAVGAVVICRMFDVKKNITAGLIGAMVVSFPTVTSVMLYNYVADAYALAFLLATLAAFFISKKRPNFILAVIFIALSVGIYQAYVTVTITLLLCNLILQVFDNRSKVKEILLKAAKYLLIGVAGMALYYVILLITLKITGTTLLEYQGIDNLTSLSGFNILKSLYTIKEAFVNLFFDFSKGFNAFAILNIIVFALLFVFLLTEIIKNKLNVAKILVLLVCIVLLPIGAGALSFINGDVDFHNLMKMGFFAFYLLLILQYENVQLKSEKFNVVKLWAILILMITLIFNQIVIANVSYHKLNMAYQKSYGVIIRIADRIEQTEGTENCNKILVLGTLDDSEAYSAMLPPEITGTTDGYIIRADDEMVGQSVFCSAINDYCGKNYKFVAGQEKEELLNKFDENILNVWPQSNSILVIDNVIVIKLSN